MYVCVGAHTPQEGFRFLEAGVTGNWKLPDMDAENWPQVLQEKCALLTTEPSLKLNRVFGGGGFVVLLVGVTFIIRKLFILKKAT